MQFIISLISLICLWPHNQSFAQANDTAEAIQQLTEMSLKINCVTPYVERADLGRFRVLENAVTATKFSIQENGYSHRSTIQSYDLMMIKFDRSALFLQVIQTDLSAPCITDLWNHHLDIVNTRGLPVASRMVFNIFDELKRRMDELTKANIPSELIEKITQLYPEFGHVISIAQSQGDTPPTYEVATSLYHKITALYPGFNEISDSNAAFDLTVDIIGLAEFYREFASVE